MRDGFGLGGLCALLCLAAIPFVAHADFEIPDPVATLAAEHSGIQITNLWEGDAPPVINGAELDGVTDEWTIYFLTPQEETPAERGVYLLAHFDLDTHIASNYSYVHAPIPDGLIVNAQTVPFDLPPLGDPFTPSGTYQLFVFRFPETKMFCQEEPPFDCFEQPYTEEDFLEFVYYDLQDNESPEGQEPPIIYNPELVDTLGFAYVAGTPEAHAPGVSSLGQFRQFGEDEIAEGASFVGNAAVFKADVMDADSVEAYLEVEVKPVGVPFDGENLEVSSPAEPGQFEVAVEELIPVTEHYQQGGNIKSFHWRARAVDAEGNASEWQEFGTDVDAADFTARVVPLWTQVDSGFPEQIDEETWTNSAYASGTDEECGDEDGGLNATIGTCGCAITSAVMLAHYYDVTQGIDSSRVTPRSINAWLQANNGYTSGNALKWAKVQHYLGENVNGQPHSNFALQTVLDSSGNRTHKIADMAVLEGFLANESPIFAFDRRAGHYFVVDSKVARSASTPTYTLRDPFWYETKILDEPIAVPQRIRRYGNTFSYATVFTKLDEPKRIAARTDFYLASPAELLVTDSLGRRVGKDPTTGAVFNEIPDALYYEEDPIFTSETEVDSSTVHRVKVLELPELTDGEYAVQVIGTGDGSYTLAAHMTDDAGETTEKVFSASTTPNQVTEYELAVADGEPIDTEPVAATVPELIDELKSAIKQSDARPLAKLALQAQVVMVESLYRKGKYKEAKLVITALEAEIGLLEKKKRISSADADTILGILAELKGAL